MTRENQMRVGALTRELRALLTLYVVDTAVTLNRAVTVGLDSAPGTAVDTGEARASWLWGLGGPPDAPPLAKLPTYSIPGDDEIEALMADYRLGDTVGAVNVSAHFAILDGGRRQGSRGMLGSEQTPDGTTLPAIAATAVAMEGWQP